MKNRFILITLMVVVIGCAFSTKEDKFTPKINGIALEAPSTPFTRDFFGDLTAINANYVCHIPYTILNNDGLVVNNDAPDWKWWGESKEGIQVSTAMASNHTLTNMIKPHLWIRGGSFTGDFDLQTEEQWQVWEQSYSDYILRYAALAESNGAQLFCIGTELKNCVAKRPDFWKKLIEEVRSVYTGKITYAGNWDSYKYFPHWDLVDYIGVDAYFPLSDARVPEVAQLEAAWFPWKKELQDLAVLHNKKILFTEYGYCSAEYGAKEPWKTAYQAKASELTQKNAYTAIYNQFWKEEWFAGGFLWKWHVPSHFDANRLKTRFTPQGKDGVEVVKLAYDN